MVSTCLAILDEAAEWLNLHDLPDYAVVQINDTQPPPWSSELVRLLVDRAFMASSRRGCRSVVAAWWLTPTTRYPAEASRSGRSESLKTAVSGAHRGHRGQLDELERAENGSNDAVHRATAWCT